MAEKSPNFSAVSSAEEKATVDLCPTFFMINF